MTATRCRKTVVTPRPRLPLTLVGPEEDGALQSRSKFEPLNYSAVLREPWVTRVIFSLSLEL
jgi:hypothetical protein